MVDFDKLRDIQQKENMSEELLKLNSDFYRNTEKYLEQLLQEIERQDGRAETLLKDEFDSAIKVIENIFHRRIGKTIALTTRYIQNEEPDTKKMLPIEKEIYRSVCSELEEAKNQVMQEIHPEKTHQKTEKPRENQETQQKQQTQQKNSQTKQNNKKTARKPEKQHPDEETEKTFNNSQHSYTVVRILDSFPRFVSSDHRTHHLKKEDIVCIPNNDAEVLMERKIANKIKPR
ncbi:MAG: hypothetical protein EF811_02490 [Methanonatronarchaeia archaeon]|nr:MAG: hypothetical protein EF811_02490 [Methanonatronarchaeia archaeon]